MAGKGDDSKLPPAIEGFGADESRRAKAVAAYGQQLGSIDLEALDDDAEDPAEVARRSAKTAPAPQAASAPARKPNPRPQPREPARPNLEPVGDDAHPPQNRRMPTQPPSSLLLDLDDDSQRPPGEDPAPRKNDGTVPPPPQLGPRQSPAPVRQGLFSTDRITNLLGGAAIGLFLMIYPAKKFARSYEVREVEPMITDLEGALEHPLGVEAGLVEKPEAIAAKIHEGRSKVRRRYMLIWLLAGLPIGIGIGFAPRPWD